MKYEETPLTNGKKMKLFKKKDLEMESKATTKKPKQASKPKTTLSIYTYLNFRQFGLAVRIDDGIKVTVLWLETHIKFEKLAK